MRRVRPRHRPHRIALRLESAPDERSRVAFPYMAFVTGAWSDRVRRRFNGHHDNRGTSADEPCGNSNGVVTVRSQSGCASGTRLRMLHWVGRVPARTGSQHRSDRGSTVGRIQIGTRGPRRCRIVPHGAAGWVRDRGTRSGRGDSSAPRRTPGCHRSGSARHAGGFTRHGWRCRHLGVATGGVDPEERGNGSVRLLISSGRISTSR